MGNQTPQTQTEDRKPANKSSWTTSRLIAIALSLGAVVGVGGVYVAGGFDGNATGGGGAANASLSSQMQAEAARLRPLFTGDIAAMLVRSDVKMIGDLSFNNGEGEAITLADTGDGYRLVNIWATWCAPCREEMPWLDELHAKAGSDDFSVVAISVDGGDASKPRAFYDEIGISDLPFFHDPTIGVFNRLREEGLALGLPVTLLINGENRVVANMNGPAHWNSPDAYALVNALTEK
ncbi:MAG: TlpA disulfide reductase family protein [Pseudomonadota bacterium]